MKKFAIATTLTALLMGGTALAGPVDNIVGQFEGYGYGNIDVRDDGNTVTIRGTRNGVDRTIVYDQSHNTILSDDSRGSNDNGRNDINGLDNNGVNDNDIGGNDNGRDDIGGRDDNGGNDNGGNDNGGNDNGGNDNGGNDNGGNNGGNDGGDGEDD